MVLSLSKDDIRSVATWPLIIEALRDGHRGPKPEVGDSFVGGAGNTMLVRSAWVDGLAAGVKAATVVPDNGKRDLPSIHAQVMLFDPTTGQLMALLDGTEVTPWKTAADSALGCDLLARQDVETLVMIGAGTMAEPLIRAHLTVRPGLKRILLWNRTPEKAVALVQQLSDLSQKVQVANSREEAVPQADIVSCATMSSEPVLAGEWLQPGTHVDLVGAYKPDMREADDEVHSRGRWFVDSFDTTLNHIGELKIPLAAGTIQRADVQGDLHDLVAGRAGRQSGEEITVFKNGGGAHLDVMTSAALADAYNKQRS